MPKSQFIRKQLSVARAGAFSLIELLVVITIIALLLVILLPALSMMRRNSKLIQCQANLKNLTTAWNQYLMTYNYHFFQGVNKQLNFGGKQGSNTPYFGPNVRKPLNPMLGEKEITMNDIPTFRCPADTGGETVSPSCYQVFGTSYESNVRLVGDTNFYIPPQDPSRDVWLKVRKRIADLRSSRVTASPSETPLVGDIGWLARWDRVSRERVAWHGDYKRFNIGFLDGHVAYVRIRKGIHVDTGFKMIPFKDLFPEASRSQREVPD
ncbi:MAG: DUF1559 domain-containing protein [Phycisphaerales bacterium]|nr:DUF1559 domain-containing protein [Phycisphaerales bacterium]